MNKIRKFRFTEDYNCSIGTLKKNSVVEFVNGHVYFDGGLLSQEWSKTIEKIIKNNKDKITEEIE
jgi:hypothetical protein